jgi:hypothetical protein
LSPQPAHWRPATAHRWLSLFPRGASPRRCPTSGDRGRARPGLSASFEDTRRMGRTSFTWVSEGARSDAGPRHHLHATVSNVLAAPQISRCRCSARPHRGRGQPARVERHRRVRDDRLAPERSRQRRLRTRLGPAGRSRAPRCSRRSIPGSLVGRHPLHRPPLRQPRPPLMWRRTNVSLVPPSSRRWLNTHPRSTANDSVLATMPVRSLGVKR